VLLGTVFRNRFLYDFWQVGSSLWFSKNYHKQLQTFWWRGQILCTRMIPNVSNIFLRKLTPPPPPPPTTYGFTNGEYRAPPKTTRRQKRVLYLEKRKNDNNKKIKHRNDNSRGSCSRRWRFFFLTVLCSCNRTR